MYRVPNRWKWNYHPKKMESMRVPFHLSLDVKVQRRDSRVPPPAAVWAFSPNFLTHIWWPRAGCKDNSCCHHLPRVFGDHSFQHVHDFCFHHRPTIWALGFLCSSAADSKADSVAWVGAGISISLVIPTSTHSPHKGPAGRSSVGTAAWSLVSFWLGQHRRLSPDQTAGGQAGRGCHFENQFDSTTHSKDSPFRKVNHDMPSCRSIQMISNCWVLEHWWQLGLLGFGNCPRLSCQHGQVRGIDLNLVDSSMRLAAPRCAPLVLLQWPHQPGRNCRADMQKWLRPTPAGELHFIWIRYQFTGQHPKCSKLQTGRGSFSWSSVVLLCFLTFVVEFSSEKPEACPNMTSWTWTTSLGRWPSSPGSNDFWCRLPSSRVWPWTLRSWQRGNPLIRRLKRHLRRLQHHGKMEHMLKSEKDKNQQGEKTAVKIQETYQSSLHVSLLVVWVQGLQSLASKQPLSFRKAVQTKTNRALLQILWQVKRLKRPTPKHQTRWLLTPSTWRSGLEMMSLMWRAEFSQVQSETAAILKHTPVGGQLPRVQVRFVVLQMGLLDRTIWMIVGSLGNSCRRSCGRLWSVYCLKQFVIRWNIMKHQFLWLTHAVCSK